MYRQARQLDAFVYTVEQHLSAGENQVISICCDYDINGKTREFRKLTLGSGGYDPGEWARRWCCPQ